jgi:hypothetical protein
MISHTKMTRIEPMAVALSLAILALPMMVASTPVEALEAEVCRIEILVDGTPLTEYAARGTTYIEALRGREYAVRLTNLIDRRIAVALAVDGLNSIDAKTTSASDASKWVLGPYQTTTISGWQISSTDARRFFFTTEENSYGAWLGREANLGVIEAIVFRERTPRMTFSQWLGTRSKAAPAPTDGSTTACDGSTSNSRIARPPGSASATSTGSSSSTSACYRAPRRKMPSPAAKGRVVFRISPSRRILSVAGVKRG